MIITMIMRIVSLVAVTLALLRTVSGQDCTLCADGSAPTNAQATIPIPGVGPIPCDLAAIGISSTEVTVDECTQVRAAGFLICGCATVPDPNIALPCAFCADGSLPTNLATALPEAIPLGDDLPDSETCQDLVAAASLLQPSEIDLCDEIQTYAFLCGCADAVAPEDTSPAPSTDMFASPSPSADETIAQTDPPPSAAVPTIQPPSSNAPRVAGISGMLISTILGMLVTMLV